MAKLTAQQTPEQSCVIDTGIGPVGLAWSRHGLTRLQLPGRDRRATAALLARRGAVAASGELPQFIVDAIRLLQKYAVGERMELGTVPLDLAGLGSFDVEVYGLARRIGWGETVTYGDLARRLGSVQLARAVGQSMGRNPLPIIIPCHRVVGSGRKPGGFSAPGGLVTKARLLALEGTVLSTAAPLLTLMQEA